MSKSIPDMLEEFGIIPVIKIESAEDAVPLTKALIDGGLPAAEVTFRTAAAEQAIKNISAAYPEVFVGAGTVLTTDQAQRAIDAGAKFIVSPGFNPKVVDYCLEQNVTVTPGISTPSELEAALERGLKVLKFFPAESLGGLEMLKSMSAPYSDVKFIPTGGINAENLLPYLKFNKVLACGGSWMVKAELISTKKFDEITHLVREALTVMLGFRIIGVRLKAERLDRAAALARQFQAVFNLPISLSNSMVQFSDAFSLKKDDGVGAAGELVIGTQFLKRAIPFLQRSGIKTNSAIQGNCVELDLELDGFSVLLQEY
ncbi:bifunctional 4-hydroxy-2-oxoglutarate aldolase/2-dehydro-3-deoxy-phosphogluconate aldolase [candidate division KSB1 bacterium]|nr:bifunctional 4-hydroxy-2-oxoglutarate aldolase/2-dehydro-3-deoxy-phosphogluconate aldolase [candidate division KSB1 bacterium]